MKYSRGGDIYPLIGALRGKDHGDEQLERVRVSQLAVRVRISLLETGDDFFQARGFGLERFTEHFSGKINHQDTKARRKKRGSKFQNDCNAIENAVLIC